MYNDITALHNIPKIKNYQYIASWLIEINFFDEFFEQSTIVNINDLSESEPINNFKLRINQTEAFDIIVKYGLETCIHNQHYKEDKNNKDNILKIKKYYKKICKLLCNKIIMYIMNNNIKNNINEISKTINYYYNHKIKNKFKINPIKYLL